MSPLDHHPFARVHGPLGGDVLFLRRFEGEEGISGIFRFDVELLATRALTKDDLLGKGLGLEVSPNKEGETRIIHGIVRRMNSLGRHTGFHVYRVELVPWIWLLSLSRDCRIFQKMTVRDILQKVFEDHELSDFRFNCTESYPTREFTVQYRESALDFVSRLMEENGLFYFFEHSKDAHTLVVADHQGALATSPIQADIEFRTQGDQPLNEGVIERYSVEECVGAAEAILDDYFYEKPAADLSATVAGKGFGGHYDYPGGYVEKGEGNRLAKVRLQEDEALRSTLVGEGNCVGLIPGYRFNLKDSVSEDDDYLVVSVRHRITPIHYESAPLDPNDDDAFDYTAEFTAVPYATPFRPRRRTARPHLGVQTAIVVGPSGEEIYTDKYGRVKVRFHWDRESPNDGESSCWIRVASTWAGNKWGGIQIPRIGQEVVVDFLEGDPDRPLITGSVYNAQQMPPFGATPTQSGWKSHSTKQGAADSNEFRFEDKKGSEEVYLRGEKDLTVEVVNDETDTIGHDRKSTVKNDETLDVGHDRTVTVENDETLEVKNDRTRTVAKDETVEITGNQTLTVKTGNRTVEVKSGNLTTKAATGKVVYEAMQSIELKVGGNSIKIDQSGITLNGLMVKVEAKTMASVEGKAMTEVKGALIQVNATGMLMAKGSVSMIG